MKKLKKIILYSHLALVLTVVLPYASSAALPQNRDGWFIGMSYGLGYGEVTFGNDLVGDTKDGVTPEIRFGHMVSDKFSVSVEYNGWMYETGILPNKYRISLQHVMAALTWYPGNPEGVTGGFFMRGSCGLGWAGFASVELDDNLNQGHGIREVETGLGLAIATGYEIRVAEDFAAGLTAGYNYLNIGGDIFNKAYFIPLALSLTWYWD